MEQLFIDENGYKYIEAGEGTPIILLHGLMGGLSDFNGVLSHFSKHGFRVIIPELPLYDSPILKTNVKSFSKFLHGFIIHKNLGQVVLAGNSLGGHIALVYSKMKPEIVKGLILTGSSGLYENSMGETYPKRGDYDFIKQKTEEVFYDPKVATKELIDEVLEIVNDRNKALKVLTIAKSAIRHNMANDLPKLTVPTAIIWGKNDKVTPPNVAEEFHELLPNSELFWLDKCGHAPMMEHPDTFNQIVEGWLKKQNL
jgi:pimeloyl-ACP methyl ester carboxylesterase